MPGHKKEGGRFLLYAAAIAVLNFVFVWPAVSNGPVDYSGIEDHFKFRKRSCFPMLA